ncbi:YadA-like family protein, partial [Bartonella tribocorum]
TRILSGVRAGSITATSTDAINGAQLYSISNAVAGYFGGGASYRDGAWNAPTFTVKVFDKNGNGAEKDYSTVAEAFTGVSSSFTNLDKKIENMVINGTGDALVKQNTAGLITIGGEVSGAKISIANVNNAARILSGVRAGSITATSTDAINGAQFYAMNNTVASYFSGDAGYKDGNWNAPTFTVKVFDKNGDETEARYENVADALSSVSSSFANLNKKIGNGTGDDFVRQNNAGLITIGGSKGGDRIDIANNMRGPRVLSGIRGGAFTKTSTDAVNGSQLYFMSQTFANYFGDGAGFDGEGRWSAPTFTVTSFDKDGNEIEEKYMDVASAFAGVNNVIKGLHKQITGEEDGLQKNNDPNDIISEGFPFMMRMARSISDEDTSPVTTSDVSLDVPSEDGDRPHGIEPRDIEGDALKLNGSSYNANGKKITSVADGSVSKGSREAVNGGQLFEVEKNANEAIARVEKKADGAVSYDVDEKTGKKTNTITLKGGDESQPVTIDNVADGSLAKGSKQAVNGGQLMQKMDEVLTNAKEYTNIAVENGVNTAKAYTDMKFEALSYDIQNVRKEARQAAAIGLAVSNLRYFDDPGSLSVSFGGGLWRGQSAFAIGAGYTSENGKIRSNLSATSAGGQWGVGGGITLKLK